MVIPFRPKPCDWSSSRTGSHRASRSFIRPSRSARSISPSVLPPSVPPITNLSLSLRLFCRFITRPPFPLCICLPSVLSAVHFHPSRIQTLPVPPRSFTNFLLLFLLPSALQTSLLILHPCPSFPSCCLLSPPLCHFPSCSRATNFSSAC